jgi:UDP-2,3-diacylglucosamine hydrolase
MGDDREGIVIYCKERLKHEHFDYCIFGHRHTPLTREIAAGCTYVNTGDWLMNRNYAVFNPASGTVELHDIAVEQR